MRLLGSYILRGWSQAVVVISLSVLVSLFIPILSLFSSVLAALVMLRNDTLVSMKILLIALLVVGLVAQLVGIGAPAGVLFALMIWVPLYMCCYMLRQTQSQATLVMAAVIIAVAYIVLMHSMIEDIPAWWLQSVQLWIENVFPDGNDLGYMDVFVQAVPLMNAMVAGSIANALIIVVLIARWWQSLLFNPGGFRKEFYALRLPMELIVLPFFAVVLWYFDIGSKVSMGSDILFVVVIMYLFHGLATIHRVMHTKNMRYPWLVVMYVLLFLVPQLVLVVSGLGLLDSCAGRPDKRNQNNVN